MSNTGSYGHNNNSTEGQAIMHRKVRSYLQIEQDIIINFECAYKSNCSSNLVKNVSINESTPVPLPSNTIDQPNSI